MARKRTGRRKPRKHGGKGARPDAFHQANPVLPRASFSFLGEADTQAIKRRALDLLQDHGVAVIHAGAFAALRPRRRQKRP